MRQKMEEKVKTKHVNLYWQIFYESKKTVADSREMTTSAADLRNYGGLSESWWKNSLQAHLFR